MTVIYSRNALMHGIKLILNNTQNVLCIITENKNFNICIYSISPSQCLILVYLILINNNSFIKVLF